MDYTGRDMTGIDLRGVDLTNQILFGTDLRGSKVGSMRLSFDCDTFTGLMLDDDQIGLFLVMVSRANLSPGWREAIEEAVVLQLGESRARSIIRLIEMAAP